jgi:hypothetical protein
MDYFAGTSFLNKVNNRIPIITDISRSADECFNVIGSIDINNSYRFIINRSILTEKTVGIYAGTIAVPDPTTFSFPYKMKVSKGVGIIDSKKIIAFKYKPYLCNFSYGNKTELIGFYSISI